MTVCPWWEQVSAALDGEMGPEEHAAAMAHAEECPRCRTGSIVARDLVPARDASSLLIDPARLTGRERRWFGGRWTRWLLVAAAIVIVTASVPAYIAGDGLSPDSHAARHLASWQIGFGVGLFVAAAFSRMSHAMLTLAVTFASLTLIARVIDVIQGQHGPWVDSVHLMELLGVFLLWRLTPSHLLPFRVRDGAPTDQRPALRSVPGADERPTAPR